MLVEYYNVENVTNLKDYLAAKAKNNFPYKRIDGVGYRFIGGTWLQEPSDFTKIEINVKHNPDGTKVQRS